MPKGKTNAVGSGMKLIACSIELPLLRRIDELANRDGITRASWMREAIIECAKGDKKFQRTPVLRKTVIPLTSGGHPGTLPQQEARA
jgi:hypothetical protein